METPDASTCTQSKRLADKIPGAPPQVPNPLTGNPQFSPEMDAQATFPKEGFPAGRVFYLRIGFRRDPGKLIGGFPIPLIKSRVRQLD